MSKWKLVRQTHGAEVYNFCEGEEITIGRRINNEIVLESIVVSRRHCVVKAFADYVTVEDLKSCNGTYLDSNKLEPYYCYPVQNATVIGVGWTDGAGLAKIADEQKFVFKLFKANTEKSICDGKSSSEGQAITVKKECGTGNNTETDYDSY